MNEQELRIAASELVREIGFDREIILIPCIGGGNNRVFEIDTGGGVSLLLKSYFYHPDDPRDRLGAEFAFARFAWDRGIRRLPQPLAIDAKRRLGLFEFIKGRKLEAGQVTAEAVAQALALVEEVNRDKTGADNIPVASEACFTLSAHLNTVTGRLDRLKKIDAHTTIHEHAGKFVEAELLPAWREVEREALTNAGRLGIDLNEALAETDRCLSPSDFGFHNSIVPDHGLIRFIDFEYAGWDDPAKLVCDFFNQIAVPVPQNYYPHFAGTVVAGLSRPNFHRQRVDLLMRVYAVKWATIALNSFLLVGASRRRFAQAEHEDASRLLSQLDKARRCLANLSTTTCLG